MLEVTSIDAIADPKPHLLTRSQFAALRKLADILLPANGNMPGAVTAEAPQFLDFYLSQSDAARQTLYRNGLDHLNENDFIADLWSLMMPYLTEEAHEELKMLSTNSNLRFN